MSEKVKKEGQENFSQKSQDKTLKNDQKETPKVENKENKKKPTELEENVAELKKEIENLKDQNIRLLADIDNQRKLHVREMIERTKYSNEKLLQRLLFFPDNYEKALQATQQIEQVPKQDLEKVLEWLKNKLPKETDASKKAELEEQKKQLEQQIQNLGVIQGKIKVLGEGLQMILL
jgi:molecular chaperone GrpE (heat shock protein)